MLSVVALGAGRSICDAQTLPRVTVSIYTGANGSGAASQLENMLRSAGMNETPIDFGFLGSPADNPDSDVALAFGGDVRVRLWPRVSVGLSVSGSSDGSTHAVEDGFFTSVNFDADYSVRSVAPMVMFHPSPRVRIGAGPALHRVTYNNQAAGVAMRDTKAGWIGEAGFAFFNGKRMFSEITARYLGIGSVTLDPLTLQGESAFPGQPATVVNLPATEISYRHWVIGVSFGFKLG